jgi:hypothetical protein
MRRLASLALCAALPVVTLVSPAFSQTTTTTSTGSVGCTAITQAAANGLTARVGADDQSINSPLSVTGMTCLSNFFGGIGLDVVTNLLNPQNLLNAVEMQICNLVKSEWNSLIGSAQCGLTLTGFNFGFGGLGGGLSCPKLSFGGGGPPIGSIGLGVGSGTGLYIPGQGMAPSGYTPPITLQPGVF